MGYQNCGWIVIQIFTFWWLQCWLFSLMKKCCEGGRGRWGVRRGGSSSLWRRIWRRDRIPNRPLPKPGKQIVVLHASVFLGSDRICGLNFRPDMYCISGFSICRSEASLWICIHVLYSHSYFFFVGLLLSPQIVHILDMLSWLVNEGRNMWKILSNEFFLRLSDTAFCSRISFE